ncbi:MAG: hypothetical protein LUH58_10060 [Lachnospiraceae bacterium]|nr:hypothetical protein [Lachnospiraceae bacterium]
MGASEIHHRLDLLVRLIDTTTGDEVEERNVRFFEGERPVAPISRGSGNYVFLNCGREDRDLEVKAYGYESCTVNVRYDRLDEKMPFCEAFLIPSENAAGGQPVITFSGTLPGITGIQAADARSTGCSISSFDERRRIMKLFKSSRTGMDSVYYALLHPDRQNFEPFEVVKEMPGNAVKLQKPLAEPFQVNNPIARIIFGKVWPDGSYVLRVRDDAEKLIYMIRYEVQGETKFRTVDMRRAGEMKLEKEDGKWDNS